ncbi:Mre11 complex subunit Nbs1 [Ancistrocladus abbreviatus]
MGEMWGAWRVSASGRGKRLNWVIWSVFSPKVLNLTEDDIAAKFAAAIEIEYTFKQVEEVMEYLKDPSKFVVAMVSGTTINAGAIPAASKRKRRRKNQKSRRMMMATCLACLTKFPGDRSWNQGSFLKINEMDLLRAVISGYLDLSVFISPSIVSSSCSTDETIVADSDVETKSATSDQLAELDRKGEGSGDDVALSSRRDDQKTNSVEHNDRTMIRVKNDDDLESGNSDLLHSQNLIVRDVSLPVSTASVTYNQVINFKRFRKEI